MPTLIGNNPDLYKPDKKSYLNSLEYAKNLPNTESKMIFHCFWRVPRDFGRKHAAVLKSIIINHDKNTEINLWCNVDLSDNEYFKKISKFVNLRLWDLNKEVENSIVKGRIDASFIKDHSCSLEGDLARLLILHNYGGFYLDMDVIVLRNMSPLNNMQFLYQWGTSGFNQHEPNITMNGAIMRLNKNSNLSKEFLECLVNSTPHKNSTAWGNSMYSKVQSQDLTVLPGVWFNSEWGFEGTVNDPFRKKETIDLFDGAFTWHWHNKWDDEIEEGSKFYILEKNINARFNDL
jgi:hypothetical protein